MRKTIALLKGENSKLKAKVLQSEKELVQKNKEIKKLLGQGTMGQYGGKESKKSTPLVSGLKKRIAAALKENKALKEGLENLKKTMKMTTNKELNAEIKVYSDECIRLRGLLEKTGEGKTYVGSEDTEELTKKIKEQEELINKLKQDNEQLSKKVKKASEEHDKSKGKDEEKRNSLEIANKSLTKEIKNLKEQIEILKKSNSSKDQAEELQQAKNALMNQEKNYEQRIKDLERRLADAQKGESKPKEKERSIEKPKEIEKPKVEMIKIVDKDSVKDIGTELRLNFILGNVAPNEISKKVFSDFNDDKKLSIQNLVTILKTNPASLKDNDALILARYLVDVCRGILA